MKLKHAEDVAVYPKPNPHNLRMRQGILVQASLSRSFLHDGHAGLSLAARSTLSSNQIFLFVIPNRFSGEESAVGSKKQIPRYARNDKQGKVIWAPFFLVHHFFWFIQRRFLVYSEINGPVAQVARAHP